MLTNSLFFVLGQVCATKRKGISHPFLLAFPVPPKSGSAQALRHAPLLEESRTPVNELFINLLCFASRRQKLSVPALLSISWRAARIPYGAASFNSSIACRERGTICGLAIFILSADIVQTPPSKSTSFHRSPVNSDARRNTYGIRAKASSTCTTWQRFIHILIPRRSFPTSAGSVKHARCFGGGAFVNSSTR